MAEPATDELNVRLQLPGDLSRFELPAGVQKRLQFLLDKQDSGDELTDDERVEAEGLLELVDMLSLLRLRATHDSLADD